MDSTKQGTCINRCGVTAAEPPLSPGGESPISSFTVTWPLPLCVKQKAPGQLEGSQAWDPASWLKRTHTCSLYLGWRRSPSLMLELWCINIFQICWRKEQEHGSLHVSNWPYNWESKSWALVTEPSLILCLTLHCYCLLLFWKITLKVSHIQMCAWTLYVLQKPAKWSCSWQCLYLSLGVVTLTETDKQSQIRRGISYQSQIFPWAALTVQWALIHSLGFFGLFLMNTLIYYSRAEKSVCRCHKLQGCQETDWRVKEALHMSQAASGGGGDRSALYRCFSAKQNAKPETLLQRINVSCQGWWAGWSKSLSFHL